jgi:hypothetical protein
MTGAILAAALTFRATDLWPVSLLALALLGLAIVWFYGPQAKALSRPWHWLLPLLRGAALVALSVSILRPVLSVQKPREEQGTVLVLLDRSMSMGVTDRALGAGAAPGRDDDERRRNISELVSLAEATGLIPDHKRRQAAIGGGGVERLSTMAEEIRRTRREVEYARLSGRDASEVQSRLELIVSAFTVAARGAADDAARRGARAEEIEQLERLARQPNGDDREWLASLPAVIDEMRRDDQAAQRTLDAQLYRDDAQVRQACDELARLSRAGLSWRLLSGGSHSLFQRFEDRTPFTAFAIGQQAVPLDAAPAPDDETVELVPRAIDVASDLTGGLRRALQRAGRQSLQAVVLVSDGRHVGAPPTIPAGLLPSGVPVFPVYAAAPVTRDLAIAGVELPESVFVGEELTVRVDVHSSGLDVSKLAGRASLHSSDAQAIETPLFVKDRRIEPVELKIALRKPGIQKLTVSLPPQGGEATMSNNRVERWVKVLAQRLRVLAISGSPGWDYRYMRNALARAPFIDLREALVVPGSSVLGMSPREILEQDVVILTDVARDALTLAQWDAIGRLVQERGGSVILVPGVTHLRQQWSDHVMADLLPYDPRATRPIWRIWPGESPYYHAVPSRQGERLRALKLDAPGDRAGPRWDELPGFYQYMAIGELKPNARVLLVERESQAPLLTEGRIGTGRVLFLGMSETWRWRYKLGSRVQDRFWLQLVRHAADEPYALVSGRMSVDVDRVVIRPGDPLRVRARLTRHPDEPLPERLDTYIMQGGAHVRGGMLEAVGGAASGRYEAVINDLAPGQFDLFVSGPPEDGMANDIRMHVSVEPNREAELADVSGDRAFLQRLAEASGGRCIDLAEMPSLPGLLRDVRERRPRVSEVSLWDSPLLFVFVLSCLAAEWALRKRIGLA